MILILIIFLLGTQLRKVGARPPLPSFGNQKKCPDFFWEKNIRLCVEFPFQNIVLRVSRRKNFNIFPCRAIFPCVFDEMFTKVPQSHKMSDCTPVF